LRSVKQDNPAYSLRRPPEGLPRLRACTLLFLVAFVLRLGIGFATRRSADLYDNEMHRAAGSLAANGTLGNPYTCPTGPTAHVRPRLCCVPGFAYRYAGRPEVLIVIATSAVASMTYALLPWLAVNLWTQLPGRLCGGLFGAVLPFLPGMEARVPGSRVGGLAIRGCSRRHGGYWRSPASELRSGLASSGASPSCLGRRWRPLLP